MKLHTIIPTILIKEASTLEPMFKNEVQTNLREKTPGFLSELLMLPNAQRDTGRLSGLAELEGLSEEQNMSVRYPTTNRAISMGLGALGGGALGALASKGATTEKQMLGSGLGVAGGAALGAFIDTMMRRKEKKRIESEVHSNRTTTHYPFNTELKPGNPLAQLVSGVHQQGRADSLEFITGKRKFADNPNMQTMDILSKIPYIGGVMGIPLMAGQAVNFHKAQDRMNNINIDKEDAQKKLKEELG